MMYTFMVANIAAISAGASSDATQSILDDEIYNEKFADTIFQQIVIYSRGTLKMTGLLALAN